MTDDRRDAPDAGPGTESGPRRIRDVDSVVVALRLKAFAWSLFAIVPGALVGSVPLAIGGFALAFFGTLIVTEYSGRAAGSLYFAGGRGIAGRREYSLAESFIARGRFDDAIAELEQASARHPDDPEPPLRLARLLRDYCARPDDALAWFRTAVDRSQKPTGVRGRSDAGVEIGALREIIEMYTHVLRKPRLALPHLARLASRHPDTSAAAWARRELAAIKQSMREEDDA